MNKVWIIERYRTFFINNTLNSNELEIDSVWTSEETAKDYLSHMSDRYDEDLDCWVSKFKLDDDDNFHYKEIELYRIFPMRVREEDWWKSR